jgi:hypothetical protein
MQLTCSLTGQILPFQPARSVKARKSMLQFLLLRLKSVQKEASSATKQNAFIFTHKKTLALTF